MDPDRGLVQISYFLVWCVVSVLLIVLYMRITLCNYKNGLLTSFSLGGASTLAERLKVFFSSRRTKVKGRRIIAIIFVFILNVGKLRNEGAPVIIAKLCLQYGRLRLKWSSQSDSN